MDLGNSLQNTMREKSLISLIHDKLLKKIRWPHQKRKEQRTRTGTEKRK